MNDHHIVYTHDRDHTKVELVCNLGDGAPCHMVRTGGLDFSDEAGAPLFGKPIEEDYGSCIAVENFKLDDIIPEYEDGEGTTFELGRVPVKVWFEWAREGWVWKRETPEESGQVTEQEYLAKVISDGQMIGASAMDIAYRLVQTDLPGLGYRKDS